MNTHLTEHAPTQVFTCKEIIHTTPLLSSGRAYSINGNHIFVCTIPPEINLLHDETLHQNLNIVLQEWDDSIDSIVLLQPQNHTAYAYYLYENGVWFTEMCWNGCVAALQHIRYTNTTDTQNITLISKRWHRVHASQPESEKYDVHFQDVLLWNDALSYLHSIKEYAFIEHSLSLLQLQIKEKINGWDPFHAVIQYRYKNPEKIHQLMMRLNVQNPITYQVLISNIIQVFTNNITLQESLKNISVDNIAIVGGEPHMIVSIPHISHTETKDIFLKWLSFLLRFCPVHTPVVDVSNPNSFFFPNQINVMFLEKNNETNPETGPKFYSWERIFNGYNLGLTAACGTWAVAVGTHLMWANSTDRIMVQNTSGAIYDIEKHNTGATLHINWTACEVAWSWVPDILDTHLLARINYDIREAKIYDRARIHNIPRNGSADATIEQRYAQLPEPFPSLYNHLGDFVEDTWCHETEILPQEPYKILAITGDLYYRNKSKHVWIWYLDSEWIPKRIPTNTTIGLMTIKKKTQNDLTHLSAQQLSYEKMLIDIFGHHEKIYSSGHIHRRTQAFFSRLHERIRTQAISDADIHTQLRTITQQLLHVIVVEIDEYVSTDHGIASINTLIDEYIASLDEKNNVDEPSLKNILMVHYKKKLKKIYIAYINSIVQQEFASVYTWDDIHVHLLEKLQQLTQLDEETMLRKTLQRYQNAFLSEFMKTTDDFHLYKDQLETAWIYQNGSFTIPLSSENDILTRYVSCINILTATPIWITFLTQIIKNNILTRDETKAVKIADLTSTAKHTRVALMWHLVQGEVCYFIEYGKEAACKSIDQAVVMELLSGNTQHTNNDTLSLAQFWSPIPIALLRAGGWLMQWSERQSAQWAIGSISDLADTLYLPPAQKMALVELSTINRITTDNGDNLAFSATWYWSSLRAIRKPVQGTNFAWPLEDIRLVSHPDTAFKIKELLDHPFDIPQLTPVEKITNLILHILQKPNTQKLLEHYKQKLVLKMAPTDTAHIQPTDIVSGGTIITKESIWYMKELLVQLYTCLAQSTGKHTALIKKLLDTIQNHLKHREQHQKEATPGDTQAVSFSTPNQPDPFVIIWNHATDAGTIHATLPPLEWRLKAEYFASLTKTRWNLLQILQQTYEQIDNAAISGILWGIAATAHHQFNSPLAEEHQQQQDEEQRVYIILSLFDYAVGLLKADNNEITIAPDLKGLIEAFAQCRIKHQHNGYISLIESACTQQHQKRSKLWNTESDDVIQLIDCLQQWYTTSTHREMLASFFAPTWSAKTRKYLYQILQNISKNL